MNRTAQRTFQISRSTAFRFVLGLGILAFLVALPAASSTKVGPKANSDLQVYAAVSAVPLAPVPLSFTVDRNDDDPSATLCTVAPNDCSLRGAIIAANANLGADTILFDPATNGTPFSLTAGPADNEFAGTGATQASGDLDIVDDLTITGNGAAATVIDGNNLDRIIDVNNFNGTNTSTRRALTVVISGVTLRNGDAKQVLVDPGPPAQFFNHNGGAIRFDGIQAATTVRGSLTITNSIITNNRAAATGGGVQAINCSLTINNTQVSNNQASNSSAGGILYNAATTAGVRTLTITNSTISNNRALTASLGSGGGISITGTSTVNINNNTISGNQAGANGGGIFANTSTTTTKAYSKNKITGNSANQGGAIFNSNGSLTFDYNLVVGNSTPALASSSFHHTAGTVAVTDDWWGCNEGPNNPSSLCDKMTGAVAANYLVLNHAATPNSILVNTSTSLQADFYTNSAGAAVLPTNLVALEGRPIVFNNAVLGTISGADTQISNGKANATYTAGAVGGTGSADATVDHATVTTYISINQTPAVTVNPTDQTACDGSSVTFTAASSGFPPPTVQWQEKIGAGPFTDIPGATSNTLTFTANISQDGNQYRAVFTNAGGSDTTTAATLTVLAAPTITGNPSNVTTCDGGPATFTASADGSTSVQWEVSTNGGGSFTPILGANSNTLMFTASSSQNGNQYRAVFSNSCGSTPTSAATLTVQPATTTSDPADDTVCQGATANFSTTAGGTGPFSYAWTVDGSPAGTDSASLAVDTTSLSVGNHTVAVTTTGACGAASQTATLTVQPSTTTSDPADATVCQGATANFSTTAGGTGPFSYAWTVDGSPAGTDSASLAVDTTSLSVGNHTVAVTTTGACGSASQSATLTVNANTTTSDPADATVCQGATANFSTTAGGTGPFSYAWTVDGAPAGTDSPNLAVDTTSLSVGNHTVAVTTTGACGSASQSATLTVQPSTTTSDPADATVCQGATANFSTTAGGTGPFSYAWTVDGSPAGTDSASLAVDTTSLSVGNHTVAVTTTGACGSASQSATLTVQQPTGTTDPADVTVCKGATANFSTTASGTGPFHYAWTLDGLPFNGDSSSISVPTGSLSSGPHTVTVTTSGSCGSAMQTAILTVGEPPVITLSTSTVSMWPPNHNYNTFNVSDFVASASGCDGDLTSSVVIANVTSDEPEDNLLGADGTTLNDIVIAPDCKSLQLRAERDGDGNGRVYTITFKVSDSQGNTTTATATVTVPVNQSGPAAVNGPGPGYSVNSLCP